MDKLHWTFDRELEEWHALDKDGEVVGRAYVRAGTPTGYYGRYSARGCGYKGFTSTLRDAKAAIQSAYDQQQASR